MKSRKESSHSLSGKAAFHTLKSRQKKSGSRRKMVSALPLAKEASTVEKYPLNEPHAHARIVRDPFRGNITYMIDEPQLSADAALKMQQLKELLMEVLEVNMMAMESREAAVDYLRNKSEELLTRFDFKLDDETKEQILYYVIRDNFGFGKIDPLMRDLYIEDISCDGANINLYVWHRRYEYIPTNVRFETAEELNSFALRLAYLCGRHISIAQPMLDASLSDGSRIHITFGSEITRRGSTFAIRKFRVDPLTIVDMINFKTISSAMAAYFWYAVENRVSIIVSGGIATGKTTLLNCLSMFIKPDMKIVSIEDTPELNLPHENWIPTTTRTHFGIGTESADITLFDLLKASLRQRPDHIIVGEVRGGEAYTLFQAISTGHLGMSTLHAESVEAAVYRLESEPMNIPRTLIAGIDIITVQRRVEHKGGSIRKTSTTSEIVGLDPRSREILTNEIYTWNSARDTFEFTGRSYLVERIAERNSISVDDAEREIRRRTKILEWMCKRNIRGYKEVSDIIRKYYETPEAVYLEATTGE